MKLTLFPGCPDDIRLIEVQEAQRVQISDTILALDFDVELLRMWSRTLKLPCGKPVAIMGVTPKWTGYASSWALIGTEALNHPVKLTKTAKQLIVRARNALFLRRMTLDVDLKHEAALRWAIHLGFEVEGIQRCYGLLGEDAYLLSRIWP